MQTSSLFRFHKTYFLLALALFITEVLIALYLNDRFIRPYVGDFLVVILLYCFFKSFLQISSTRLAIAVLLFAYAIEGAQYLHLVARLGMEHNRLVRTVLGSSAEWSDMLAYTLGIAFVVVLERNKPFAKT